MPDASTAPERISALGNALAVVSRRLDELLAQDVLTTNFMRADAGRKYVPAYLFAFVREASTCERYEDLSRDNRAFVDLMISHVRRVAPGGDVSPLLVLRDRLARHPADSEGHRAETRALHRARMLHIGSELLKETAAAGLAERDASRGSDADRVLALSAPLPYASRADIARHAVALLADQGLDREASAATAFLCYNPVLHG